MVSHVCSMDNLRETYTNGCEYILELVDKSNETGIIDIDPKF